MADPKNPSVGDMNIDGGEFPTKDLTPEEVKALTKVHEGFEKAVEALLNLKAGEISALALNTDELMRLEVLYTQDQRYTKFIPATAKMLELLTEGQLQGRHEMSMILTEMASQSRRRGSKVPNVLGPVEPLLDYQYGPAAKAVATRKKAEAEAEAKAKAEAEAKAKAEAAAKAGATPVPSGGGATGPTG